MRITMWIPYQSYMSSEVTPVCDIVYREDKVQQNIQD